MTSQPPDDIEIATALGHARAETPVYVPRTDDEILEMIHPGFDGDPETILSAYCDAFTLRSAELGYPDEDDRASLAADGITGVRGQVELLKSTYGPNWSKRGGGTWHPNSARPRN
jgi:hypothetical protein